LRKTVTILICMLAALAFSGSALAATPKPVDVRHAVQDCSSLRTTMANRLGPRIFRQTYGTAATHRRDAFARCVVIWSRAEMANRQAATAACGAEYAADPAVFTAKYGTFGTCVAQERRAMARAERHATVNAARTCMAERAADPATFRTTYGTERANYSNAFGRCVSTHAKPSSAT
jgi:hypothetical protein